MDYIQGKPRSQNVLIESSMEEKTVASPALSTQDSDPAYNVDQFIYHKETDTYQCPQGNILYTNGSLYDRGGDHRVKQYKTKACKHCPVRDHCTKAKNGRMIERSEFAEAILRNNMAIEQNQELYRRRQEIVEHPFGTIKRQWGFDHTLMKGKKKVDGEVGLIFIAYLFTRLMNILGLKGLMEAISNLVLLLKTQILTIKRHIIVVQRSTEIFLPRNYLYR
jgi:hypothetical protein